MVKYYFISLLFICCINLIYAQDTLDVNDSIVEIEIGFLLPETFPTYKFNQFEGNLCTLKPELSKSINCPYTNCDSISGSIFVTFVVSDNREISDITILRGLGPDIDKEVILVIQQLECILPATFRNKMMMYKETIRLDFNFK
jgi:hypothetical protein